MAKSGKVKHKLLILTIAPLLLINGYSLWRLNCIADSLDLPLLGSFSDGFAQIAMIILINSVVIMLFLVTKAR
jgi:hypothetical protein